MSQELGKFNNVTEVILFSRVPLQRYLSLDNYLSLQNESKQNYVASLNIPPGWSMIELYIVDIGT